MLFWTTARKNPAAARSTITATATHRPWRRREVNDPQIDTNEHKQILMQAPVLFRERSVKEIFERKFWCWERT